MPLTSDDLALVLSVSADTDEMRRSLEEVGKQIDHSAELLEKGMNEALKQGKADLKDQLATMREISELQKQKQAITAALMPPAPPSGPAFKQVGLLAGMGGAGGRQLEEIEANRRMIAGMGAAGIPYAQPHAISMAPQALHVETEARRSLNVELSRQRELLVQMQQAQRPEYMRERLGMIREEAALRHKQFMEESAAGRRQPALRERVGQGLEREEETRRTASAEAAERRRQLGLFGSAGRYLRSLGPGGEHETAAGTGLLYGALSGGGLGRTLGGALGAGFGPLGSMAGAAAGGAITGAPPAVAGMVGGVLGAASKVAVNSLQNVSQALTDLQGPLGPLGAALNLATAGLNQFDGFVKSIPLLGSALGPVTEALAGLPGTFASITQALVGMAEKASPAAFKMWTMALEDTQAVIGRAFVPVLQLMTQGVRMVGDVLANVLPNFSEASAALGEAQDAFASLRKELRNVLADIGPVIRKGVIEGLQLFAHWVGVIARTVELALPSLRGLVGAVAGAGEPARGSEGAAARPASFVGAAEYQKQLQLAAFALPGTAPMKPEDKIVGALDRNFGDTEMQARQLLADVTGAINAVKGVIDAVQGTWNNLEPIFTEVGKDISFIWKAISTPGGLARAIFTEVAPEWKRARDLDRQQDELHRRHPGSVAAPSGPLGTIRIGLGI